MCALSFTRVCLSLLIASTKRLVAAVEMQACVSLIVHTEKDLQTAKGISNEKIITIDEGLPRWQAMVDHARLDHQSAASI